MRGEAPSASRRHRALHDAWWPLAVVIFLGGVACVVIGVAPPPGVVDPVPPLLSGVVFVLIALGLVVFRGAARARQLALWATLVTTGVMIGQTVTGAGQILVADGVVLGALYAGATMVGRELVLYLASASVVVTVGMIGSSAPFLPVAWFVVVGTVLLVGAVTARNVGSLRRAATIDHLTGALNRSGLEVAATTVLAATHRHGAPLAVVMVDLDGFKRVNDTLGHAAGDRLLADLVDGWRERLREQDLAARIGGDEFVLVLPDTDAAGAEAVVAELARDAPTPWTAGVAVAGPQDTLDSLVRRADRELYRRKRSADAVEGPAGAVEG